MREHLNKLLRDEKKDNSIKANLIEYFFKVNLMAEFVPYLKTRSLFPTVRVTAETSELGYIINYYSNKLDVAKPEKIPEKVQRIQKNMVLSFGTLGCQKVTGWKGQIVAVRVKFTAWDFFFVHYYDYFSRKILPTIAKDKQLLQEKLHPCKRSDAKKFGRDTFFFGDKMEPMSTFDKFRVSIPSVDETNTPYRLSTCIDLMFKDIRGDVISTSPPPKYFDLDEHIITKGKKSAKGTRSEEEEEEQQEDEDPNEDQQVQQKQRKLSEIMAERDSEWRTVNCKRKEKARDLLVGIKNTLTLDDSDDSDDSDNSDNSDDSDNEKDNKKEKTEAEKLKAIMNQNSDMKYAIARVLKMTKKGFEKLETNFGIENPEEYPTTDDDDDSEEHDDEEYILETPKKNSKKRSTPSSNSKTKSPKDKKNTTPKSATKSETTPAKKKRKTK